MNKNNISKELNQIIDDLKNQKLDIALENLKKIPKININNNIIIKLFAAIYFKKMDWKNAIKYYEKSLNFEKEKFKIYTNIGVCYFKLGKISKSIEIFKKSIIENSKFDLAYSNLGIAYQEIGKYKEASNNFISALKLNKNNFFAQNSLINIFQLFKPTNINEHPFVEINNKITKIINKHKIIDLGQSNNIKTILNESNKIIENYYGKISFNETQLYRKNSKNLNCNRHFQVFNKFKVIPKFCFSCYKIQVNLKNIVDLIKLHFIFNSIELNNNNTRKCVVETRDKIKGNYKGYIYCDGLNDAQNILKKIKLILNKIKFKHIEITIKHGCSEFYKSYPEFEKINFNGDQEMVYKEEWKEKEFIIDKKYPIRQEIDKKVWGESLNEINLTDILIMNNWIIYAKAIGDDSCKLIYDKKINNNFINDILKFQIDFRKKDLPE